VPATCSYPEPDQSSPCPPHPHARPFHFLKMHLNIIVPSTPGFSRWSAALRFPQLKPQYTPLLSPITCFMPRPSHSIRFGLPNNMWRTVQVIISLLCRFQCSVQFARDTAHPCGLTVSLLAVCQISILVHSW